MWALGRGEKTKHIINKYHKKSKYMKHKKIKNRYNRKTIKTERDQNRLNSSEFIVAKTKVNSMRIAAIY